MIAHKNMKLGTGACRVGQVLLAMVASISLISISWAAVLPAPPTKFTKFSNIGSIANTRHNLTQSTAFDSGGYPIGAFMNSSRNDYGEVCVYCHTPHGANNFIAAPLWNRTIKPTVYTTYADLGTTTLTQVLTQPGPASLTCLSCHDGQTAIDSIINMPGSGMGLLSQQTSQNTTFLNTWPVGGGGPINHMGLNSTNNVNGNGQGNAFISYPCGNPSCPTINQAVGCLTCHSDVGSGAAAGTIADFRLFNIGTDLRNDHPIGVTFPALNGLGTDWNTPAATQGASTYFESIANGRMDKQEIRTYDGKVECASCHDPHGVPSAGTGSVFNKTFLRKQNTDGSAVCLTCHNK